MCIMDPKPVSAYSLMPYIFGLMGWRLEPASTASVGAGWANRLWAKNGTTAIGQMRNRILISLHRDGHVSLTRHSTDGDNDRYCTAWRHRLRNQRVHLHQARQLKRSFTAVAHHRGLPADGDRATQAHVGPRRPSYTPVHTRRRRHSFAGPIDRYILPARRGVGRRIQAVILVLNCALAAPRLIAGEDGGLSGRDRRRKRRGRIPPIHHHHINACLP